MDSPFSPARPVVTANLRAWCAEHAYLLAWLPAALFAIFQRGPMPMFSTRTLSVAWEMWQHHSVMVPWLNGAPYSDKPPLLLWLIHLGWLVGGVGDVWPRLLEVLLGALQLLLAARLARRLFPQQPAVARYAPWVLLAFAYAFLFGLQVMYEVLLADCVLAALLALVPRPGNDAPRFGLFTLAVALGLLSKGPVMLLHVAFIWLSGPWWQAWARRETRQWYLRGGLSLLLACVPVLTWALLAAWQGGEAYRQKLLVHQTAGRVVDSFAHAHPAWWYIAVLPVLLFPFSLWPRLWLSLARLRGPLEPGLRCVIAWLAGTFIAFSLISGKQMYYLLPLHAGFAMLIVVVVSRTPTTSRYWGAWPLVLFGVLAGSALMALPTAVQHGLIGEGAFHSALSWSLPFGVLFLLLAGLLAVLRGNVFLRIAGFGLAVVVVANTLFTLTLWPAYDFTRVARLLADAEARGQPVANYGPNDGQYTFLGRLNTPVIELHDADEALHWSAHHPGGLVITTLKHMSPAIRAQATYVQPFRGIWLAALPTDALASPQGAQLLAAPPQD